MSIVESLLVIATAVTVVGLFILILGLRGRRVGGHPFCRRCGFNLFGRPDNSVVCPECGADLTIRHATVIGMRHRRPVLIGAGVVLLLIGILPLGIAGWGVYSGIDWQKHKPVAWLVREAQGSLPRERSAALTELLRRQGASALSKQDVTTLVDAGLGVQGDVKRPWDTAWGDFIETAHSAGQTSDEQWKRYAAQAASIGWLSARVTPRIHARDPMMTYFIDSGARVGRGQSFYAVMRPVKTIVDGKEFKGSQGLHVMMPIASTASGSGGGGGGGSGQEDDLAALAPGKHSGTIIVKVRVTDPNVSFQNRPMMPTPVPPATVPPRDAKNLEQWVQAQRDAQMKWQADFQKQIQAQRTAMTAIYDGSDGNPTYADVEVPLPIQFELVAPGAPTATAITDEKYRAAIESALSIGKITIIDTHVDLTVECDPPPPVPLCFKVILRNGTNEWPVGHANFETGRNGRNRESVVGEIPQTGILIGKVEVVLRPDVELDQWGRKPDVESYWGKEVVLKDVVLEYPLREQEQREAQARRRADFLIAPQDEEGTRPAKSPAPKPTPSPVLAAAAAPLPPAATAPASVGDEIQQLEKLQVALRDKLLAVPGEDFAQYQTLLKLPDTGLLKLLPREKYSETVVGMRGGGAYYSFVRKTHEYGYGNDIELGKEGRFTVGFAGGDHGLFLPLGDVSMDDIAAATAEVPKWANERVSQGWTLMWDDSAQGPENIKQAAQDLFFNRNGRGTSGVPSDVGACYLLRSVSPDEYDILIGLRVVRKFDDGSVVIAYKLLKTFNIPHDPRDLRSGRPPRPPRKLPTTRVP